ncbi:hypothetical protein Dred_1865 [Desulforamulus reducens MI-1]|uniref:PAS domain-containing protein n=1 Tax=Desulforamulus reducens (strain ATCC BAA-1160 / DSM 100696 / MI-1) TaxID=349161 RepID=A4J5N6_DESRM|nr:PAS domain-containing protein [Desulforamulus reducens]ABO50389.1 hypothetical protein Dred_1865 [Desulforamulus reducens MI-1]
MKNPTYYKPVFQTLLSVFLVSVFILFALMEFRHTNKVLTQFETGIKQIAINKTNLYIDNLKSITVNAANKFENESSLHNFNLNNLLLMDSRITNLYIFENNGKVLKSTNNSLSNEQIRQLVIKSSGLHLFDVILSGIYKDEAKYDVISLAIPLGKKVEFKNLVMVIEFRIDQYRNELLEEFLSPNYKIAVFDSLGNTVIWPFDDIDLKSFDRSAETFYADKSRYNVSSNKSDENWQVIVFFKSTNFEFFRAITILFLVFALYICLYELLVEFWGVNTAKTYFENIDFAIFNQINEGVIIANNAGRIIFANEAAHHIFADRKNTLRNVMLKEILGNAGDTSGQQDKSFTFSVLFQDKLLKAIHSPIIKNNKILGSLSVIRTNEENESIDSNVLNTLVESLPQGIVFINKHHDVILANLMAKCYINNLLPGTSIEVVDRELAKIIYNNIDSGLSKRIQLSNNRIYEISPIYDDDGIYLGTLVIILTE